MGKDFQRGLVVGKFSPLHRGHELVIRRALESCQEVVAISYSNPELEGCEADRREQWLGELFPEVRSLVVAPGRLQCVPGNVQQNTNIPRNDADATAHRRFTGCLCREVLGVTVDSVFTSETYGDEFARELTAYFRDHDPLVPAVRHVLVDRDRKQVPISGSAIRANVHAHREWLSPVVYASFIRRVCFLGGESSGKSVLAQALGRHLKTLHVEEYGRKLWEIKNGSLAFDDLVHIAERQVADEKEALLRADRFLFCDTSPLTTLFYSRHLFGRADPKLEQLAERHYDLVVLCGTDFEFVQDGTRQDAAFREHQHAWYLAELGRRRIPFLLVTGSVANRLAQVCDRLRNTSIDLT